MNFRFTSFDFNTLIEMKTGIYALLTIASIHTFTLICYISYKYFNNFIGNETEDSKIVEENETDLDSKILLENETEDLDSKIVENETIYDSEIVQLENVKLEKIYTCMVNFENKSNELNELDKKLSVIKDSLEVVREKLTDLNNTV